MSLCRRNAILFAVLTVSLASSFGVILAPAVQAAPLTNATDHYGIVISNSCITMHKNNIETDCPNYEELMVLFPDTSNREISGDFVYDEDTDFLHRNDSQLDRHFEYYRYYSYDDSPSIVWIDPPGNIRDKISLITIQPTLPEYKIPGSSNVMVFNTIYTGQDRWIDTKCKSATLTAENWIALLGDTMRVFKNGCDYSYSHFNDVKTTVFEKTPIDITTSYKYQLEKWIAETKIKCKGLCFEY